MTEGGIHIESETSDDSTNSDDPKTTENEPHDYEKLRDLRVPRKAKKDGFELQKIADSLVDLGTSTGKGKRTQLRRSKRVSKNSKFVVDDDEYKPNDNGVGVNNDKYDDDVGDCVLNGSSKELEDEGSPKKLRKNNKEKKKKKKAVNGCDIMEIARFYSQEDDIVRKSRSNSKKVEAPPKVLIPDSSLQFTGFCEEKIQLVFPKAPEDEVMKLMERFPKGFSGFNREQGERALRWIAGLKEDYWKLRRSHVDYPEFREEVMEGLPLPDGFEGFSLEESKQISEVIVTLEAAYSKLRDYFQSDVNEGAKVLQPSVHHEASGSHPLEASCPPATQALGPQQQASSFVPSHVQPDIQGPYRFPGSHPLETPTTRASGPQQPASTFGSSPVQSDVPISSGFPNYRQNPPNWCPPFGMPMPWNPYHANYPPPSMGSYPGMPYVDAGMRPAMGNYPGMPYYDAGMRPSMGNYPGMPPSHNNVNGSVP